MGIIFAGDDHVDIEYFSFGCFLREAGPMIFIQVYHRPISRKFLIIIRDSSEHIVIRIKSCAYN